MDNDGKNQKEEFDLDEESSSDSEILTAFLLKFYDKATRKMKKWFKFSLFGLATVIILSICSIAIGINMEWNEFVTFGAILKAIASLIGLLLLAPIIIALESIGKGKVSGQGFIKFLGSCFLLQMLVALVIVFSPMSVNMVTLFSLTFSVCLFSFAMAIGNIPAIALSSALLMISGATLFFPKYRDVADNWVRGVNAPELLRLSPGDILGNKVQFYLNGKPAVKYFIIPSGRYELFKSEGSPYHDIYQGKLRPITDEIIFKLERNENLISPRNFNRGAMKSSPSPPSVSSRQAYQPPAVPTPTPAPAPYAPSSPAVSEPTSPPADSLTRYNPSSGYESKKPEKSRELAPAPRYKYATLFIGDFGSPDPDYSQKMVSWFESNAVSAADVFSRLYFSTDGTLRDADRKKLASLAENVVIIKCSTRRSNSGSRDRHYTCELEAVVIDTRTGEILKTFRKSQGASGFTDQTARQSAITLALSVAKNNLP